MSVSYHAHAVIGIVVDTGIFYGAPIKERAFAHNYGEDMAYCPKTGAKLWKVVKNPKPEYDTFKETFAGFQILEDRESAITVLCVASAEDSEGYRRSASFAKLGGDIEEQKRRLHEVLEPLGAWDESKFGLYAILTCSC
jgi:hypothetical protein